MLKLKLLCFDIRCEQLTHWRASLAAQLVKNLLAMQETWVGSLDWEDPLEKGKVTHWKKSWFLQRLKAEGEEDDRGWDGWVASPIQWMWTWANSRRWWGTKKSSILQSTGLWRAGHDLETEQEQQRPHIGESILNLWTLQCYQIPWEMATEQGSQGRAAQNTRLMWPLRWFDQLQSLAPRHY